MEANEPLIKKLQVIIHWSVRTLAILMVFAISIGYWLVVRLPRFDLELGPVKRKGKEDSDRQDENAASGTGQADVVKQE